MFRKNPLLIQLKKQLYLQKPRIEGTVKFTAKRFGFLETENQKSYFIPPIFMKKVMHGDKIRAILHTEKHREIAEPVNIIDPFLKRFIGQVQVKDNDLFIVPDHPLIKEGILVRSCCDDKKNFQTGDWAVAEMRSHPLKGDRHFYAEITSLIASANDHFAPWMITLARYNLAYKAPEIPEGIVLQKDETERNDLTEFDFITIDGANTKDIDDAIHLSNTPNGAWIMTVAIADPTAWISSGSFLDIIASERAFTHYLPGFNIPMLPRILSDNLCSLREHERRPALACQVTIHKDGSLANDANFFVAWIESKAKLAYSQVSDWIENTGMWHPENDAIANQLRLLYDVCQARNAWRKRNALVFKDRPDYRFIFDENGNVSNIIIEPRRIANRMIEEVMIAANICAANTLRDGLGYGLYNVHHGFDPLFLDQVVTILRSHHIYVKPNELLTLNGFCALRRHLNSLPTSYLENRIRRFQALGEVSSVPGPHFGMGLDVYATWTSPIRKYSDMLNHRLLKSLIGVGKAEKPTKEIIFRLTERRRQSRMAERDMGEWLYACFLKKKIGSENRFTAEVIDIYRNGIRVRLLDNGAMAFIPASLIHSFKDELIFSQSTGIVQVKDEELYRYGDILEVIVTEVKIENRSVIVRPV